MSALPHDLYCDEIIGRTDALRAAIKDADLDATVPTCPDWTLRDLAVHVGRAHRWAGEIVRTRATEAVPHERVPDPTPEGDDPAVLDAWLADGAAKTVEALRAAGPDQEVWSWGWERSAGFWARRMAHETIVHQADAALTAKTGYEVAPELAADTIEEWLEIVAFMQAAGIKEAAGPVGTGRSIHLHATDVPDAEWLIEFAEDGFTWRRAHEKATVALRGPLTDVMLVFNRRLAPDSDRVEVLGDAELLDFWLERAAFG
ncbi:maleylpyruvate isomerase family mycothiol-dependent enzyme [Streptomyces sp. BE133]|uniref:maleylpyruvate isomerase family mycothiol-dependent enzyme n=1 Tax=Streptomyces sp. BE133 TaxID=3002523 RepID=UPI002E76E66C|nr:maleylpyruvate isomerase family mycothiol-dependent enzyme [Streptomyces sp. BE133]MEE1807941.1 maleylpyruvate isomerase family mycothiol-dependent enzyme [Streptomyces sp. BE133]